MRYVSEQFKEKQNRLIRPALKLWFEVATDVQMPHWFSTSLAIQNLDDFDDSVAPIVKPTGCTNEYYYAVVGDGIGVDDPNRMCAPDNSSVIATPTHSVPVGVLDFSSVNEEMLIGSTAQSYFNFVGIPYKYTLSFKGGLIPESVRVEVYDTNTSTWSTEQTIDNSELKEEIVYTTSGVEDNGKWRRFWVKNTTKSGRYQLNWLKNNTDYDYVSNPPVVFENNRITSISVDKDTNLTSQTMPSYEMSVTCLDPDGQYKPETIYWEHQFKEGKACLLKIGYGNEAGTEYLDMMYGILTAQPDYAQNNITFKISVGFNSSGKGRANLSSLVSAIQPGGEVDSRLFSTLITSLFTSSDVIKDATDNTNTKTNHYEFIRTDSRQLVANAVGGYIVARSNEVNLHDTCDIQYKAIDDVLPRYDQIKNILQNRSKVGTLEITRYENRLASDYIDIEATERVSIPVGSASALFVLPYWAYGRIELRNAQAADPSAVVALLTAANPESVSENGTFIANIAFRSNTATTIKPIVRFYGVNSTGYQENETVGSDTGEPYINDNALVTNAYVANRVKRVARFASDVSNQYEVDVVQDLRYEIGDVIRLETEKDVFKTCVITALKFNLPGSTGHVTCRKIFAIEDSANAMSGIKNAELIKYTNGGGITVVESDRDTVVVGLVKYNNERYYIVAGASSIKKVQGGSTTIVAPNIKVTDNNAHVWNCYYFNANNTTANFTPVDLGTYSTMMMNNIYAYGVVTLITKLYEEQNMTSPVDYDCSYVVN